MNKKYIKLLKICKENKAVVLNTGVNWPALLIRCCSTSNKNEENSCYKLFRVFSIENID